MPPTQHARIKRRLRRANTRLRGFHSFAFEIRVVTRYPHNRDLGSWPPAFARPPINFLNAKIVCHRTNMFLIRFGAVSKKTIARPCEKVYEKTENSLKRKSTRFRIALSTVFGSSRLWFSEVNDGRR